MTSHEFDVLKEAYGEATQGEWVKRTHERMPSFIQAPREDKSHPYDIEVLGEDTTLYSTREQDIDFIVTAHKMMPDLLHAVEKLFEIVGASSDVSVDEIKAIAYSGLRGRS